MLPFPQDWLEKARLVVPEARWAAFEAALSGVRPVSFRVNRLLAEPGDVLAELADLNPAPVPWCADAFVLPPNTQLSSRAAWQEGRIYIQSLSSIAASLALDPQPGEAVLDLCAAPGSKTSHIAALMGNEGRLVANDASRSRSFKLRAVLDRLGAQAQVRTGPGEQLGRRLAEQFDRVLVDAPCSGEGRFHADDPESHARWSPGHVKRLASKQKALLHAGIEATRPGGVIVYSTCTLSPEENEGVLARALKKYPVELEDLPLDLDGQPALTEWKGKALPESIARARRLLPGPLFDGFFLARLRRR